MLNWSFGGGCSCAAHASTQESDPGTQESDPGRRRFLAQAVGAAGLAGVALATGAAAPRPKGLVNGKGAIDVHQHYFPKAQKDDVQKYFPRPPRGPPWTPQQSIDDMEKNGIATALLSLSLPGTWLGGVENARKLTRVCNDEGAQIVRDNPRRFGLMAHLAFPDVTGSLAEIDYALDSLKADGFGLMTSYEGKYLGDPLFTPILEKLNARKAVIFVHPNVAPCCFGIVPGIDEGTIEYATDTTRTMSSLLFSGQAERFPDIQWIFAHSGGTFPFLTGRMIRAGAGKKPGQADWPLPAARKFHYEIAQGIQPGQLAALMKLVPPSQLLFGSDFPFRPAGEAMDGLANYPFTRAELAALKRGTAERMIPRLATL